MSMAVEVCVVRWQDVDCAVCVRGEVSVGMGQEGSHAPRLYAPAGTMYMGVTSLPSPNINHYYQNHNALHIYKIKSA